MKKILTAATLTFITFLAGCASGPPIDTHYSAVSQDNRVQFLIIHYTAGDFPRSLKTLTEEAVSSHYLVSDNPPTIYRLVSEDRRAYHAGQSSWRGFTQLNASSIGIEIVNRGRNDTADGSIWFDYPQAQVDVVIALVKQIVAKYQIPPERVLGHSDIAPQRKTDPGPRFPWKQLADLGLVQWPDANRVQQKLPEFAGTLPDVEWFQNKLARHGFEVPRNGELDEPTRAVVRAFQMKYRPNNIDGTPDAETAAMLEVLTTPDPLKSPMPAANTAAVTVPMAATVTTTMTVPVTISNPTSKPTSMIMPLSRGPSMQLALSNQLDAEFAAIVANPAKPIASLSVLAVREGGVVYKRQFGYKFIDNEKPENSNRGDVDTLYRVASISKMITTLGVMKLVEEGKLNLDRDISDYLGYRLRNPNFPNDAITIRMLLSHTSSMRDEGGYYWEAKTDLKDVLLPGARFYDKGEMWAKNAKPGAFFQYANLPWGVLGTVMERASGERFDRLMTRTIFAPMGIAGGFNPAEFSKETLANLATLYRKRTEIDGKEIWNMAGPWNPQVDDYSKLAPIPRAGPDYVIGSNGTAFGPQGGARLSAPSLGKIMLMLMNGGKHEGTQILSAKSVELMLSNQWQNNPKANNGARGESGFSGQTKLFNAWGLGMQQFLDISGPNEGDRLVEGGGFKAVGHLGDAWGLTAAIVFDPVKKNGMIFLIGGLGFDPETNKGKYSALFRHEEQILDALYRRAILQQ